MKLFADVATVACPIQKDV